MNPHFLFPCDPMRTRKIDEAFRPQAEALAAAGFGYAIVNLEGDHITGSTTFFDLEKYGFVGHYPIIYRGWMLNEDEHDKLQSIIGMYAGKPLTNKNQYYQTHHIPNWYPMLSDLTAETLTFPNEFLNLEELPSLLRTLGWKEYFVKDYVKSLKTAGGSMIHDPEQISRVVAEMEKYRGTIEGGVCVRKFEEYIPQTEIRFFVVNGKVFAPKIDSNMRMLAESDLADVVAERIDAPFYSVDIAMRADFTPRVVECGDGQVSDLVGWTPEEFAQIWG